MVNLYTNPNHRAKIGYQGFDMSQLLKFTSTTGELRPVYYEVLQPGDKVTCNSELKTRTMPLASPVMCNIKERIEWFFVPMNQIYAPFEDWYFGISDVKSSLMSQLNLYAQSKLPYIAPQNVGSLVSLLGAAADFYFGQHYSSDNVYGTAFRLMEDLGVPVGNLNFYGSSNLGINPYLFCAYQKIYFDYYRLSDREANDPSAYNLDAYYMNLSIPHTSAASMFRLRYRPRQKDFFTSNYTSPLMGASSIGAISYGNPNPGFDLTKSFNQWLASSMSLQTSQSAGLVPSGTASVYPVQNNIDAVQVTAGTNGQPSASLSNYSYASYSSLSPAQIRTSFAVEKLLEITRRAGKHFDCQMLAHFGVEPPKGISGEVTFLGKQESEIIIGDVVSTADTSNAPLGKIAGKGYNYGKGSSPVKFEADCHGVLMAIYSAEPVSDYPAWGFDKLNTLIDRSDWFTPEFDDLGMQPLFDYQQEYIDSSYSQIKGWQYRYWELKNKPNLVKGALRAERSLDYWTVQQRWRLDYYSDYLVSPFALSDVMLVRYNNGVYDSTGQVINPEKQWFNTDPLIHEVYFDVKKASKMSTFGLPSL